MSYDEAKQIVYETLIPRVGVSFTNLAYPSADFTVWQNVGGWVTHDTYNGVGLTLSDWWDGLNKGKIRCLP